MVVPSWQEIIDDIIEVLSLKHPALKDASAISSVSINNGRNQADAIMVLADIETNVKDDMIDDMLDTLVVYKFTCGHVIKVPKHLYETIADDATIVCQKCL